MNEKDLPTYKYACLKCSWQGSELMEKEYEMDGHKSKENIYLCPKCSGSIVKVY